MSKNKRETVTGPGGTIRAGTKLPPEVAAMVTVGVILTRAGDDASGLYDQMSGTTLLQVDGDEHILQRIEVSYALGALTPAIDALVRALTEAMGGEVTNDGPKALMPRVGRVGRA